MDMKKIISILPLAAAMWFAAGCSVMEKDSPIISVEEEDEILISKSFQADISKTRTTLEGVTVLFSEGESISIWDGIGNREYKADETGARVSFSGEVSASATEFFALSPYSASAVFSRSGNTVTASTTLPSAQTAVAGTFADGLNISAAKSDAEDSFSLENAFSVGKLTLNAANLGGHSVTSITLSSTYPLAGDVVVTYGDTPAAAAGPSTVKTVTLAKADGSALEDGTYYFVLLPNAGGEITLKFTASDGYTATKTATLKSAFEAGSIKNLGTVKGLSWEEPKYYFLPVSEMSDGTYLIVADNSGTLLTANAVIPSSGNTYGYPKTTDVTALVDNNGFIVTDDLTDAFIFTGSGSGYTIQQLYDSKYWYQSGNYTSISIADGISSDSYYTVTRNSSDGTFKILNNTTNRYLQYSTTYKTFGSYTSSSGIVPTLYRLVDPDTVSAAVTLTTLDASSITGSSAVLNAAYSGLFPINAVNVGFYYGLTSTNLDQSVYVNDTFTASSVSISAEIASLSENTTYYFRATMQVWDPASNAYKEFLGNVLSFTTKSGASGGNSGLQWLGCYEVPALDLANEKAYSDRGGERFGSSYWFNYKTNNSMQKVVTHTYAYNNKTYRNYTTLVDGNKRCPLWTAYVMHRDAYPDNNVGRVGSFSEGTSYDPAIDKAWQSSGSTGDYSTTNFARGHMCASNDRQATQDANKQTFYYTNQCPQKQDGFNNGVWSSLEEDIQNHAPSGRDTLYVVVGTLFEDGNIADSNDGGTVARPSHFYKLLMKCSFNASGTMTSASGVAYLYTNEDHSNDNNGKKVNYYDSRYVTTIDAIEQRSGFDFFVNVPEDLQTAAENMTTQLW
mgnify:CR=1 FL=1